MPIKYYRVADIEGEYAILKDEEGGEDLFIAMALLPQGTDRGSRLRFENFSYELLRDDS